MAIQKLRVEVDVSITDAVESLRRLEDKLEELSDKISAVDLRGAEGIDIRSSIDEIDDDLARIQAKLEAFEATTGLDIGSDVRGGGLGGGGGGGGMGLAPDVMRGVMRDAFADAFEGADFDFRGADFGGGGGGRSMTEGFNRPFMAPGSLAASRMTRVSQGFDLLDDIGDDPDILQRLGMAIDGAIEDIDDFKLRMSDLHNLMASLIPLLIVFLGTIPTAITALLTLAAAALSAAAAFVAIAGLGALGVGLEDGQFDMQRLKDVLSQLRDSFIEAFAPLAERLEPLFMDAVTGLEELFRNIADQGDALMELTDDASAFGGFLLDFIPLVLRNMAALANAMGPVFGELGQFLMNNLTGIVREFLDITLESLPALITLGENLALLLKFLARAGIGFSIVSSAVLDFAGAMSAVFNILGITDAQLGLLLGTMLSLVSLFSLASFVIGNQVLGAMAGYITALNAAIARQVVLRSTLLAGLVSAMAQAIVSLVAAAGAQISFATATLIAAGALASFITLATLGAGAALSAAALGMASDFLGVADSIDQAADSMREFNRVSGGTSGPGFNPFGGQSASGSAAMGGSGGTTINLETTGDKEQDSSNMQKAQWLQGRTSGDRR